MMAASSSEERTSTGTNGHDSTSAHAIKDEEAEAGPPSKQKPSLWSRMWTKSGLNMGMLMMMVKGALPPTISLAIYESTSVAKIYSTLGYLVAIMSVLSFAILPRSKFIQTMVLNVIGVCIGAAVALLEIYCSVQARAHTTPPALSPSSAGPSPGAKVAPYNSSAAAVCAIWLFFNIYVVNTLRASRPQLQFPAIVCSIFTDVASIYAPSFPTMSAGISFTERLLEAFLTGFAIATGVSLFIFPVTVRMTFFKQSAGFIQLVQGTLKAQIAYLQSLETADIFSLPGELKEGHHFWHRSQSRKPAMSLEAANLKGAVAGLGELHGKIHADLTFAKRETAFGKLDASDISELSKLMQGIFLPLTGVSSATDIFQRIAEKWAAVEVEGPRSHEEVVAELGAQWNQIMKSLHDPFEAMTGAMIAGLQHTLYMLELSKAPVKKRQDVEATVGVLEPGDVGYAKQLQSTVNEFYEKRKATLAVYCQQKGLSMTDNPSERMSQFVSQSKVQRNVRDDINDLSHQRNQRQLFLVLYVSEPTSMLRTANSLCLLPSLPLLH